MVWSGVNIIVVVKELLFSVEWTDVKLVVDSNSVLINVRGVSDEGNGTELVIDPVVSGVELTSAIEVGVDAPWKIYKISSKMTNKKLVI